MEAMLERMTDDEFADAFETCQLPNALFHHRDHLRLAWIYLRRYGSAEAGAQIAKSIQRYAAHHGATQKYHETVTLAWLQLVDYAASRAPAGARLEDALASFPELLDKNTLGQYYSRAALDSDTARVIFTQPDLKPLPTRSPVIAGRL
jgi:hypothetical protein